MMKVDVSLSERNHVPETGTLSMFLKIKCTSLEVIDISCHSMIYISSILKKESKVWSYIETSDL